MVTHNVLLRWLHFVRRTSLATRRWATAAYLLLVAGASLTPGEMIERVPIHILFLDKVIHCAMYGGMAFLVFHCVNSDRRLLLRTAFSLVVSLSYGILMEVLQRSIEGVGRTFSLEDIGANALGAAVVAAGLGWRLHRQRAPLADVLPGEACR